MCVLLLLRCLSNDGIQVGATSWPIHRPWWGDDLEAGEVWGLGVKEARGKKLIGSELTARAKSAYRPHVKVMVEVAGRGAPCIHRAKKVA